LIQSPVEKLPDMELLQPADFGRGSWRSSSAAALLFDGPSPALFRQFFRPVDPSVADEMLLKSHRL
jgi:hypothetical protein